MKKYLTILFVLILQISFGQKTYYFSSSSGSDGNSGTSNSFPYQSINKLNSLTLNPGDHILFKRGDTFVGRITVNQSGTAGNPITFDAYGSGPNPLFNGLASVTSWTNIGGNIWQSTSAVSTLPTLKMVTVNGMPVRIGTTPNADETYPYLPNYFTIDKHTGTGNGTTTIKSSSLTTNWTGADVVVRVNHWTLDKETITVQNIDTISFIGQSNSDPITDGWGFWIQNDTRTLDRQNEWYYNPSTKKIRIYSSLQPQNVQVTTVDTMIYARVKDYITINGIDFKGANNSAIVFSACNNPIVTNCNFQYTGATAIEANDGSNNLDLENSTFYDIAGACIWNTDGGANWVIKNNTMKRIGLVSVIKPDDYTNGPIEINSPAALVQYNNIDSTAYEGIHFRGNDVQIRNNFVNHTSMLRDDGGGIYTGFANETGKIIDGNIVINSVGNARGVGSRDAAGNGIYNDGMSVGVTVTNNTVAHIVSAGIFLNNNQGMNVRGNTVYDVGGDYWTRGCLMIQSYTGTPYAGYQRNNSVTNNIFFQKRPSQVDIFNYTDDNSNNSIQDFGIIDSNFYAKGTDNTYFVTYRPQFGTYQNLNFSEWQTASGKEAHGSYLSTAIDTNNIKFVYNPSKNDSIVSLDAVYKDVKGNTYNGSITLQPYRSSILMYNSALSNPPSVTTSGNQSIAQNSTTIYSTPVAGSSNSITSVAWTQVSGPSNATIGTPMSNNTSVSDLVNGTYIFQVLVTQTDGQTASAQVTVIVNVPTPPPTITNSGDQTNVTIDSTAVSATATWASGHTGSYQWTQVSGPNTAVIWSYLSPMTWLKGLINGTYIFRCTATQSDGQTATTDITIVVNIPNPSPTANAGANQTITLPVSSVNLSGSYTVASGYTATFSWSKVSGSGSQTIANNTTLTPTVSGFTSAGVYVFQLKVLQSDGQFATSTVTVTVNPKVNPSTPHVNFPVQPYLMQIK